MLSFKYIVLAGVSLIALFFHPFQHKEEKPDSSNYSTDIVFSQETIDSLVRENLVIVDTPYKPSRFPLYRPKDRFSDPFSSGENRSRLFDGTENLIRTEIEFAPDSTGNKYIVNERLGRLNYRSPTLLSEREINEIQLREDLKKYWTEQSNAQNQETTTGSGRLIPKIPIENKAFERIFGGNYVEFQPTGFVNLDFGIQYQKVANPQLPIRQQRNTNFDFDPHANVNLIGKIGDKLQISGSFDTKSSFQFENNFKLEYTGYEEDIIQKIEFGNVNFPLSTTLIQGAQNLFGVTTKLRFGRLTVNSVFSNQRARAEQVNLQGGAQKRNFEIAAGDYEDNRHFFIAQFFRDRYENSLRTLPIITSQIQITRLEVYTTNRVNNTESLRNIAAFLDLGESAKAYKPNNPNILAPADRQPVSNNTNRLFNAIAPVRNADNASNDLTSVYNLVKGEDFEILRAARKLSDREYTFNRELGYLSLLTPLRNDEILAVAFEYTFNGQTFKVGELTEDYQNFQNGEVIHMKLIRPSSIRLDLPSWNLMMKNVYSLNASQVSRQNFQLRVIYKDDLTGIDNPSLQEGIRTKDQPLLRVVGLDRLNQQNDPQRDGNFDFVEGVTIDSRNGKIYFPVLEPFGSNLIGDANFASDASQIKFDPLNETALINKYVFFQLYESTKADALQAADKNKFFLKGNFEASSSSDVSLPGINIAPGSVKVTAGNIPLVEGEQYTVDYSTGRVQIIDESVLNSGKEIKIDYEKADLFNFQVRRLMGTRFDYQVNKDFIIGATVMNLAERPVITRVNIGDEPVNNTVIGGDINYKSKSRFLTRLVDKIPLIQTKEESDITFYGEYAQVFPGSSKFSKEISYIDEFEGTRTAFNLVRAPQINWKLGSTPQLFAEANAPGNQLNYTFRRAKLAWYNVDNLFYRSGNLKPNNITVEDAKNHYTRSVVPQEIFRNRQPLQIQTNELIFDLAFFPSERGPYNYNPDLNFDGTLKNPTRNWGAITRAITSDIDFDNANVEYIEFWMLDPFISGEKGKVLDGKSNSNNTTGGDLYINLGNVSEDIMRDGRHAYENGLAINGADPSNSAANAWGLVTNQQYLTNAFDNTDGVRGNQDIGLDGLRSSGGTSNEANYFSNFINQLPASLTSEARSAILADPSADDFSYYLGPDKDGADQKIVERYKNFNGLENNSPVGTTSAGNFTPSSSNNPDNEDLNIDNTISDLEAYYQYKMPLRPGQLQVGNGYIIDKVDYADDDGDRVSWYLFRIPIRNFDEKVGNISGFKSIRFMRMFVTNFSQPVVLRFAQYQLVANQWRRYLDDLSDRSFGLPTEPYDANFNVSTVSIEENGASGTGVTPYVLPPGVIRDRDVTNINNRQINEQSMRLCVDNLRDKDARAVFRNYRLDLLSYKRVKMFIHAESNNALAGELTGLIRLGTDFTENYYEVEVPLLMTPEGSTDAGTIWPKENEIDIAFADLVATKSERNRAGQNLSVPYSRFVGQYRVTVVGNPDLSAVQTAMIGIRNPDLAVFGKTDDKLPKSVCIWVNEFRITDFEQTPGWAALARTNIKLADFAQVTASASYTTFGFGSINQKISERTRKTTTSFDIAATVALDKFFPEKLGLRIPLFASYERLNVTPRFNPLDPDVPLKTSLENFDTEEERKEYEQLVEENNTRRSLNFTNVRKVKTNPEAKVHFWDIENLAFTWAYSEERRSNITTASYLSTTQRWSLAYTYDKQAKFIEPFKNSKFLSSPYFKLIKDFNFSILPSSVAIRGDLDRKFEKTQYRGADLTTRGVEPLFQKIFTFNRLYDLRWSLSKSLTFSYNAAANALVDEPDGELDTQDKRDSLWTNLKKLGRMKNFTQRISLNYKIPLDKIPLIDWLSADAIYGAGYNWASGAVGRQGQVGVVDTLGSVISNNRERSLNGRVDFSKLYKKSKFLRDVESPPRKTVVDPKKNPKDTIKVTPPRNTDFWKALVRPFLLLKNINITYSLQDQTILPGFKPVPKYLGFDRDFMTPGFDFIFGGQNPDIRWIAAERDWLARSTYQNNPFLQSQRENLTLGANLEPVPEFKIQVDVKKTRQVNYQEIFRNIQADTTLEAVFDGLNPLRSGNYAISHIAIRTAFVKDDSLNSNAVFKTFATNRNIILERLTTLNPNSSATKQYDLNSQDVLIPAFLAAYTKADVNKINLSPFPKTPLPNWRIDYTGLSKINFLKEIFASVNLTHSYSSNYSVNNYTSSLQYGSSFVDIKNKEYIYTIPDSVNSQGQFIPVYVIGQVLISERFGPLVGVNVRTKSNLSLRFDYNQERDLSLNLSNAQIAETRSKSIVVSVGFNKANMKLPFRSQGKFIVLKNDLDLRIDLTIRDSKTIQRQLDAESTITGGNLNFQLRPVISYAANQQLNLQFYFELNINDPGLSSSFKRRNTTGGIQLRYSIAQ